MSQTWILRSIEIACRREFLALFRQATGGRAGASAFCVRALSNGLKSQGAEVQEGARNQADLFRQSDAGLPSAGDSAGT